jgi:large subunit ribosomal protein L6
MPIDVPQNVSVEIKPGNEVLVKGPKGQLQRAFSPDIIIEKDDNQLIVKRSSDHRLQRMQHGLTRALLNNMVVGVSSGFKRVLQIEGVGYRAEMQGPKMVLFMGYSHPVEMDPPAGIAFSVDKSGRTVTVEGADKEQVGLIASRVRGVRPPEPYHGKGIRYEKEVVRRKQGKTGK